MNNSKFLEPKLLNLIEYGGISGEIKGKWCFTKAEKIFYNRRLEQKLIWRNESIDIDIYQELLFLT